MNPKKKIDKKVNSRRESQVGLARRSAARRQQVAGGRLPPLGGFLFANGRGPRHRATNQRPGGLCARTLVAWTGRCRLRADNCRRWTDEMRLACRYSDIIARVRTPAYLCTPEYAYPYDDELLTQPKALYRRNSLDYKKTKMD